MRRLLSTRLLSQHLTPSARYVFNLFIQGSCHNMLLRQLSILQCLFVTHPLPILHILLTRCIAIPRLETRWNRVRACPISDFLAILPHVHLRNLPLQTSISPGTIGRKMSITVTCFSTCSDWLRALKSPHGAQVRCERSSILIARYRRTPTNGFLYKQLGFRWQL